MATQNAVAPDPILLSAWNRNYRLSLEIIVAGVVMLVAVIAFGFWASLTGSYSASGWGGLSFELIGTAGFMLIVLGASWAYTNRRILQLREGNP